MDIEGSIGGVFGIQIAVKTGVEEKGRKRPNDADQNNDCHKFYESEALLSIHDIYFGLDTDLHGSTRIKISVITN